MLQNLAKKFKVWNKTLDQLLKVLRHKTAFWCKLKNLFVCLILLQICYFFYFFYFFSAFCIKNAVNDYFNQCLGCAAPKCWLKYTTLRIWLKLQDWTFQSRLNLRFELVTLHTCPDTESNSGWRWATTK